jgi:hypothetical protein
MILRSVMIGDVDWYPSEFIYGVNQGMTILGHTHVSVNIRHPIGMINQCLERMRPDVIWVHMLLWAPAGAPPVVDLLALCEQWRKRGTRVLIHDGDHNGYKKEAKFPNDISHAVDLTLCNHVYQHTHWNIPSLRWPYGAFWQSAPATPMSDWACQLFFAGRGGGNIYEERSAMLEALKHRLGDAFRVYISPPSPGTIYLTPGIATAAGAVLGYGRPLDPGWADVRVFQYPGAGGILIHDDADEFLTPYEHYLPYKSGDVDSILEALDEVPKYGPMIREQAFKYVQTHHSWVKRVQDALGKVGLG